MNKRYQVRWYEYNLTQPRCRNFFTEIGAQLFRLYKKLVTKEKTILYERYTIGEYNK